MKTLDPTFDLEWRARFERFGRTHQDEALVSGWSEPGLRRRLRRFRGLLSSLRLPVDATVLDLGCGAGTYVRLLGGLGYRTVGVDYSIPSLARATAADPVRPGLYVNGDAYQLPFAAGSFDLVVSIGVLQALASPERALDEMQRVLRGAGTLVVEALNARAAMTRLRRVHDAVRGLPRRVRTYEPEQIHAWLVARGLAVDDQVGIYLPPRRLRGLERILDLPVVAQTLEQRTRLRTMLAHSFLFVARTGPTSARQRETREP